MVYAGCLSTSHSMAFSWSGHMQMDTVLEQDNSFVIFTYTHTHTHFTSNRKPYYGNAPATCIQLGIITMQFPHLWTVKRKPL